MRLVRSPVLGFGIPTASAKYLPPNAKVMSPIGGISDFAGLRRFLPSEVRLHERQLPPLWSGVPALGVPAPSGGTEQPPAGHQHVSQVVPFLGMNCNSWATRHQRPSRSFSGDAQGRCPPPGCCRSRRRSVSAPLWCAPSVPRLGIVGFPLTLIVPGFAAHRTRPANLLSFAICGSYLAVDERVGETLYFTRKRPSPQRCEYNVRSPTAATRTP